MADKNHPEGSPANGDKPRLPPRSADWHSGLKKDDPNNYKAVTPEQAADRKAEVHELAQAGAPEKTAAATGAVEVSTWEFYSRRTRLSDWLLASLLGVIAFFMVVTSYGGFGHSWDEALYLKPSERAAAWMMGFFNSGDDDMLQRGAVNRHWGEFLDGHDPLHPEVAPVPKLLNGAGLTYLKTLGYGPMVSMRLPVALLFACTVALLFLLGSREYGRVGGFAAAIIYALTPRVFGHAHIAASETPLAFFVVLTVWCYLVANRFWPFALFTGIAFGLAVATKISALMIPVPLMIWGQVYRRRDYASNVFAMAFIAPVVVLAVWPWLWYDGLKRFFGYILFYTEHQKTAVFYMNRIWGYGRDVAPIYYPLHIAVLALPVWILVFLALGILRAIFNTIGRPVTILFVIMAAAWFALSMLPNAPRYDGERLFFPVFAFLALLAGGGFSAIFCFVRKWRERRGGDQPSREVGYIAAIALLVFGVYGSAIVYLNHPNELNYYNEIVGGGSGAREQGYETSYWGEAVNDEVTDYLSSILQPGDKVKTLALNELAFENLRQWGKLPDKVEFSPEYPPYDYVIMQVRQGFMGVLERQLYRSRKPLKTFEVRGVPRIMVFHGATVNDLFGEAPVDTVSTETFAGLTTGTLQVPGDEVTSSPLTSLLSESSPTLLMDEVTTDSVNTTGSIQTAILDLPTSTAEMSTSTEERLSTVAVELLTQPATRETSAPGIYEGTVPSTGSVEREEPGV